MTLPELIGLAVRASIFLTVLGLGLSATWRDATSLLREPGLMVRSLIAMFVAMPIVAGVVAAAFDLPTCGQGRPGRAGDRAGAADPAQEGAQGGRTRRLRGRPSGAERRSRDRLRASGGRSVRSHLRPRGRSVSPIAIAKIMFMTVLIPLVIGIALRHGFPAAAEKASSWVLDDRDVLCWWLQCFRY